MGSSKVESPIIKELKALKVESSDEREIIETDTLIIGVVICEITSKTLRDETKKYTVGACFEDKIKKLLYPFVFRKKFTEKTKAYNYYHDIINRIKTSDDMIIFEAMKNDDISLL